VLLLKGSRLIPDTVRISGWVYEVETGKVRRVVKVLCLALELECILGRYGLGGWNWS
jgi:hypothetical protein